MLPPTGPVMGIFAGASHGIASVRLEPGETLLLYTDGVPEAKSRAGEQFTEKHLQSLLNPWQGSAAGLLQTIAGAVDKFAQGADQHDDITMLASYRETG